MNPDDKNQNLSTMIGHLFWWTPEEERSSLSADAIVEAVLSNGNEKTVRQLFDVFGIETVAQIFDRQTSRQRTNYRPRTIHYFRQYFHRHAQRHSDGKPDQAPAADPGILP